MKSSAKLGKVQLRIMQVLWDKGEATARDITDSLSKQDAIAHSTVQTLLRGLEEKGAITHEVRDRTFVFSPLVRQTEATRTATRDLVSRVFHNSVSGLVAHLLQHEEISKEELAQLRQMVEDKALEVENNE